MTLSVMLGRKAENECKNYKGDGSLFFRSENKDPELGAKIHCR